MSSGASELGPAAVIVSGSAPDRRTAASLPIGEPTLSGAVRLALATAGALMIAICAVWAVVYLAFAAGARRWLAFQFTGIPAEPHVAAGIFLHNLRALAAVGGLLLIAQAPHWARRGPGSAHRALQRIGEGLLAAAVAANVIVVGAGLGAYGTRMGRAALPHGPVELAAYSLALALYIQGRRRPLAARHVIVVLTLATSLLAVAAVLETFVGV